MAQEINNGHSELTLRPVDKYAMLFKMLKNLFKVHQMLISQRAGHQNVVQTDGQTDGRAKLHQNIKCLRHSFQA